MVTTVFCDLTGSTGLGERLQPEVFREVLTRYYETARPVFEAHGGVVQKYIGDAILAVFGIPRLHEDDARRAVEAADELRRILPTLNQELERNRGVRVAIRIGIHTGEIAIGGSNQGGFELLGDVLNVASRLEQLAAPDEIIIGETTWWLVRGIVTVEPLGPVTLRGRAAAVSAYRLLSVFPPAADQTPNLDVGMIGREQEQAWLRMAYERAVRERTCHLVTVLGPAGIGKSRLISEFASTVAKEATVLRGRCLAYGNGITFWPIAVAVRQAAGISADDPPAAAKARLSALLGAQEQADRIVARVAELLGLIEPSAAQENAFWGVRRLLEVLANRRPLILIVDDLQWAEPTLLDLIEYIAGQSREAPILIVCLARPELLDDRPTWGGGKLNSTSMLLCSLTEAESSQLVSYLLGSGLAPDVKAAIVRTAEGNPLFIEELVASAEDGGRFPAIGDLPLGHAGEPTMPPTIQAVLAARLDRLSPEERAVLERAAVVGINFPLTGLLEFSQDMTHARMSEILETLVRKELIRPYTPDLFPGEGFRFRHALIRDTVYAAIPKDRRAELHERLADLQERALGDRAKEIEEITAYHLSKAYRYRTELGPPDERTWRLGRRAGEMYAAAGRRAARRGDVPATVSLLNQAVALLPEDHPARPEVLLVLAEALEGAGEVDQAATVIATAIDAAKRAGDVGRVAHAVLGRLMLQSYTELETLLNEGQREIENVFETFEQLGDDSGLAIGWRLIAEISCTSGDCTSARDAIERAIEAARRAGEQRLEARALGRACWVVFFGPAPLDEVVAYIEPILSWAERTGSRRLEADALRVLARVHAMRGNFTEARELLGAANTITTRLGEVLFGPWNANIGGFVELLAGDYEAAERAVRRSYETHARFFGVSGHSASLAGMLARILVALDRLAEAEHFAAISERFAASKDVDAQVKWRRARSRILASRSRLAEAERLAREEVAVADGTDWLDLRAEARMDLAHVLRRAQRPEEAHRVVDEAVELYERKGNLVAARSVQALV